MTDRQAHLGEKPASVSHDSRVVPFRPREQLLADRDKANDTGHARDLSRFENPTADPDEFRRRIVVNLAALILMIVLIGVGIWLAVSITRLRDIQDCILTGRRDCAGISVPQT